MKAVHTESQIVQRQTRKNETWGGILRHKEVIDEDCFLYTTIANQSRYIETPLLSALYVELTKDLKIGNRGKRDHRLAVLSLFNACFEAIYNWPEDGLVAVLWPTSTSGTSQTRYKRKVFSPNARRPAADLLQSNGYIQFFKGGNDPKSFVPGLVSLALPTEKLVELFLEVEAEDEHLIKELEFETQEVVLLQDEQRNLIEYAESDFTNHQRVLLNSMSLFNQSFSWTYTGVDGSARRLTNASLKLYRLFKNSSFGNYGRIHCDAQGLSKTERKTLKIDGEETVELDYKSMSATLAYVCAGREMEGKPYVMEGDAYRLDGYKRKQVKTAFQICMNTMSKKTAIKTIDARISGVDGASLVSAIERNHRAIRNCFYKGFWMSTLTIIESDIMQQVLQHCEGFSIPALPIHDAILCRKRDSEKVLKFMKNLFEKKCGISPVIEMSQPPEKIDALSCV